MAIFEDSGTLKYKDKAGNLHIMKPRTTSDNVEGLAQLLAEKENSGAAANALENAKAYTDQKIEGIPTPDVSAQIKAHNESQDAHPYIRGLIPTKTSQIENDSGYLTQHQDISGKLDKPANDATATAGQLLTKTVNGQEWKDREKDVFVVTISVVSNTTYTADKTFLEIQEAYDAGKVCFALIVFEAKILLPIVQLVKDRIAAFSASSNDMILLLMIHADNSIELENKKFQTYITATGLLKGNGNGGVSAAVAGTDYVTPDGMNSAVAEAKPFIVTFTYNGDYHADKTFEEIKAAYDAGKMCYANFLGNICLRGVFSNSYVMFNIFEARGSSESITTGMGFVRIYSDNSIVFNGIHNQPVITASGLLKGDGNGGVSAATAGSDYIASGNIVKQTLVATETTPTENYAINWVYG